MQNLKYNIRDFDYNKESKTFTASLNKLYPIDTNYHIPFPNGRRHFYIKNLKTNKFRRFTYKNSIKMDGIEFWVYISEDDYKAHIKVD